MILPQSKLPIANTVTTTAGTVLVLFDRAVFAAPVLVFSFEVIRVTAGTERRVPQFIGIVVTIDTRAYRPSVTAITPWIPAVIARIVPLFAVTEVGRRPAVGGMTHVALFGRG